MVSTSPAVLVVGAGPTGLYATQKLAQEGLSVAWVNRDLIPGGMAEYGIHPSKQPLRDALRKQFQSLLQRPNVAYFGGISVGDGGHVTAHELQHLQFSACLFATGAQGAAPLNLQGAEAAGIYSAKALLAHWNAHPHLVPYDFPVGQKIAILGTGDLMAEVALWLVAAEGGREVILLDPALGPWQPALRGCSALQLRHIVHAIDPLLFADELKRIEAYLSDAGESPTSLQRKLTELRQRAASSAGTTQAVVRFRLLASAQQLLCEGGRISGLALEQNRLIRQGDTLTIQPTGQHDQLTVDTLIYASSDEQEVNFYPCANSSLTGNSSASLDAVTSTYLMQDNAPCDGCFVAGWARTPTLGVNVGKARRDGEMAAQAMLAYLQKQAPSGGANHPVESLTQLLDRKGLRYLTNATLTSYPTWPSSQRTMELHTNKQGASHEQILATLEQDMAWEVPPTRTSALQRPQVEALLISTGGDTRSHYYAGQRLIASVAESTANQVQLALPDQTRIVFPALPVEELPPGAEVHVQINAFDPQRVVLFCDYATTLWSIAHQLYAKGQSVSVTVTTPTEDGVWVRLSEHFEAFIPRDELALDMLSEAEQQQRLTPGETLAAWVAGVQQHRILLTLCKYKVCPIEAGDILKGHIEQIGRYGLHVRLEDANHHGGLLPNNELSWTRKITHPQEFYAFTPGASLYVQVKGFTWDGKPELSLKSFHPDPWREMESRYSVGQRCQIQFSQWLKPEEKYRGFQGFVEYDVQGFVVDAPWLTDDRSRFLYQLLSFQIAEPLEAIIKDIDPDNKRVFLSMLEAQPDLLEQQHTKLQQRFQPGSLVQAQVLSASAAAASLLFDELAEPVSLPREAATAFLRPGQGLDQLLAPQQSVIVKVLDLRIEQTLHLQLSLQGLGPVLAVAG